MARIFRQERIRVVYVIALIKDGRATGKKGDVIHSACLQFPDRDGIVTGWAMATSGAVGRSATRETG